MDKNILTLRDIDISELPSEAAITENWNGQTEVIVSIACTTFDHEAYIETCVKSFLLQRTSFPFEIIIHDDCSTDNTSSIIHNLLKNYPKIIKIIQQAENQYSKGIRILPEIIAPICKGKYIAICEGDDAWNYRSKLAKQVKLLESHPSIIAACHGAFIFNATTDSIKEIKYLNPKSRFLTRGELILAGGAYIPTASLMVRREVFIDIPSWWKDAPVGDYPLILRAGQLGNVWYENNPWCTYRVHVPGSWSQRTPREFSKYQIHAERMAALLVSFSAEESLFIRKASLIMASKYIFDLILRTNGTDQEKHFALKNNKEKITPIDRILINIYLKFDVKTEKIHTAIKFFMKFLFRNVN